MHSNEEPVCGGGLDSVGQEERMKTPWEIPRCVL